MSIADKLSTVANNVPRVFAAGKESGYSTGKIEGIAEGKQTEYNRFWDNYQYNGDRTDYAAAFAGIGWTDEVHNPKYTLLPVTKCLKMFENTAITRIDYDIDVTAVTDFSNMFAGAENLTNIKLLKFSALSKTGNMFANCFALTEIRVSGSINYTISFQYSPLSVASMKSIISCLANYAGTSNAGKYKITFTSNCWAALEADSTSPNGSTWKDYVVYTLGWTA